MSDMDKIKLIYNENEVELGKLGTYNTCVFEDYPGVERDFFSLWFRYNFEISFETLSKIRGIFEERKVMVYINPELIMSYLNLQRKMMEANILAHYDSGFFVRIYVKEGAMKNE